MRQIPLSLLLVACAGICAGCGPADPGRVHDFAQAVFDRMRTREYAELYNEASVAFRKNYPREEFVRRMEALEAFGQLVEIEPTGEPSFVERRGGRVATAGYVARFAFAEGPFVLRLRANDMLGTWELEGYDYDVASTTTDPPYPPDDAGADQLARRFFYLWQSRRYGDLRRAMRLQDDPQKVRTFLEKLENAGKILSLNRRSYQTSSSQGRRTALAEYDLKGKNSAGESTGDIAFRLVEAGGEWRIESVDYEIEYKTK